MKPNAEDRRSATEDRLRAALAARAGLVTHRDLRHDVPPQGRGWGVRRVQLVAFAVLGAAAAVLAVCLLVALPGGPSDRTPVQPAGTPGVSAPPTSTPTTPVGSSDASPRVTSRP